MTAHARLGTTTPTLGEQVAELRAMVIDQRARIEALEAASDDAVVDGRPRAGKWLKMKEASRQSGFSRRYIEKLCRAGRARYDYDGPHRLVDISGLPVRKVRTIRT